MTKGSTTVSLGYDGAGRLSTLTFPSSPALVQTYGYNDADQLTGITYQRGANPADDLLYTLDPLGRRTAVSGTFARTGLPAATTATAAYDTANRLTSWNGAAVTYDNNGNLLTQGGLTYAYNARNQLKSVKQGSTTLGAFVHDGLGRRVQKTISGTVTKYVYDGWNVVQERDSKNKITANMLAGPGLDQWLSRIPVTGSASYYLTDALGSTVGLADPTGSVATSYTYEPFGKTTVAGTSNTNPFRFTGREEDSTGALSLYHYRARYYSPSLQRFLTEDPIGFAGGDANLYGYVWNAPTSFADPSGTCGLLPDSSDGPIDWFDAFVVSMGERAERGVFGSAGASQAIRAAHIVSGVLVGMQIAADFASARCDGASVGRAIVESLVQNGLSAGLSFGAFAGCLYFAPAGPEAPVFCAIATVIGSTLGRRFGGPVGSAAGGAFDWITEQLARGFATVVRPNF